MQIGGGIVPWWSTGQIIALLVVLVLGLELSFPIGGCAQQGQMSVPVMGQNNQELPPIQEAATVYERKPYYKKWWFWALVVAAVAGGAGAIAIASGGGGGGSATSGGTVTVNGPAPQ